MSLFTHVVIVNRTITVPQLSEARAQDYAALLMANDPTRTVEVRPVEHCPCCGSAVFVESTGTTHSYRPLEAS